MSKGFEQIRRAADQAAKRVAQDHALRTPVVVMLGETELSALDVWISDQAEPKPSRSEAARQFILKGLVRR